MFPALTDILFSNFLNGNFHKNRKNYIIQSLIIAFCLSLVLLVYRFFGGIVVASLGASSFILFITPHTNASKTRNLTGGYVFGSVSGIVFGLLHTEIAALGFAGAEYVLILICAAAAAAATFLMISTNLVHPPAAALALGLSSDPDCVRTAAAAVIGVILLCLIRKILKKHLKNLI
ncbi:MAG: HPP family protein [Oscillospiraceae bacterium]|nr:HPP family protein [Oscillospiraceae bacterium]